MTDATKAALAKLMELHPGPFLRDDRPGYVRLVDANGTLLLHGPCAWNRNLPYPGNEPESAGLMADILASLSTDETIKPQPA